jgi:pimeloyl-ACP methyl ester carboxylesterase
MTLRRSTWVLVFVSLAVGLTAAQEKRRDDLKKPLVIASQGSFFVGGEKKALPDVPSALGTGGDVTVNQMYVQYQLPQGADQRAPVVMVHGCCLSSKTWESTPDGRMGWSEYFVRRGRGVYLADQVSRARSGFDATTINAVKAGSMPAAQLPNVIMASHQTAWTVFRFGPTFNTAFPDGQFPVEAADELYKQMIPDLNAILPTPNPTWGNLAALGVRLKGAVLMGHSESGLFPEQAALIDPTGIKGIISIEMPCTVNAFGAPPEEMTAAQIEKLAKIPTLIMFGDHLGDIQGGLANWAEFHAGCQKFVERLKAAGGDAEMMYLPALGIKGNSHMLMQDRNNLQLADLVIAWLDAHVDGKTASQRR